MFGTEPTAWFDITEMELLRDHLTTNFFARDGSGQKFAGTVLLPFADTQADMNLKKPAVELEDPTACPTVSKSNMGASGRLHRAVSSKYIFSIRIKVLTIILKVP